ncbi:retrovirus-related pol polyprotein from transposon TNT 1-94 [Tanacetum coccineum]|uniref:Retrovirus-related pol polyprotein from transposon TNT 1-94 n=1 Tax=Tanacetum coccineum TaxID=301880 RepID=A0ABQ5CBL6_9ASTR
MEAIRIFLAYAAHKSFIDADHPSHVYKLKKALCGLKQTPRAWYDELLKFLLQNHFTKGTVDPTLFTRHYDDNSLVVQVYVDDIIFGSTNPRSLGMSGHLQEYFLRNSILRRKSDELVLEKARLYIVVNYERRICVSIRLLCLSSLDENIVNEL